MAGPADVLWVAGQEADAHVTEDPPGSNAVPYWDWWYDSAGVQGAGAWCATFVSWCFARAGLPLPAINTAKGFSYVPDGVAFAFRYGEAVADPQPGDIVLYSWYQFWNDPATNGVPRVTTQAANNAGHPEWANTIAGDHVGIFAGWNGDGSFTAIEGNTSASSWDNGGAVMRRSDRWPHQVCCWWRPSAYIDSLGMASVSAPTTNSALPTGVLKVGSIGGMVTRVQQFLTQMSVRIGNPTISPGPVDGEYGPQTAAAVAAWQRVLFAASAAEWDGEWGPRTAMASEQFAAVPVLPPPPQPVVPNAPPDALNQPLSLEDEDMNIHEGRLRPSLYDGRQVLDFDFVVANGGIVNSKVFQSCFLMISPVEPGHAAPPFDVMVSNVGPSEPSDSASNPIQEWTPVTVMPWGTWRPVKYYGRLSVVFDPSKPIRAFVREGYFPL